MAAPKTKALNMSASSVLDVLEGKHFKTGPYEMLREVRNGTGYGQQTRSADALVVSTWPSRGVWFGGVEVKISRTDWKRELDDPSKSHEIQRFCSYWWIAAPEGLVQLAELPETWGLIEVTPSTAKVVKIAPKLEAQPPTAVFIASVLRSCVGRDQAAFNRGRDTAFKEARERYAGGEDTQLIKNALELAKLHQQGAEKKLDELRDDLAAFEKATGVSISHFSYPPAADRFNTLRRAVQALDGVSLGNMAKALNEAAARLQLAERELEAAKHRDVKPDNDVQEAGAAE